MKIMEAIQVLEQAAPLSYQEGYDNAGLLTGNSNWNCTGILCTLDATEQVIMEAKERGCNLVVAHHPIIFGGLKKITGRNYVEKSVISAIKHDIAIYAIHTNLDNVLHGVNNRIADRLGLVSRRILAPKDGQLMKRCSFVPLAEVAYDIIPLANEHTEVGSGLIGELPEPVTEEGFLHILKNAFELSVVRHTPLLGKRVQKVALCGGAGSFLTGRALAAGADVYVTADVKYHEFFDANDRLVIADIGHWESEQYTSELLVELLQAKFPTFAVLKSAINTNPVRYF